MEGSLNSDAGMSDEYSGEPSSGGGPVTARQFQVVSGEVRSVRIEQDVPASQQGDVPSAGSGTVVPVLTASATVGTAVSQVAAAVTGSSSAQPAGEQTMTSGVPLEVTLAAAAVTTAGAAIEVTPASVQVSPDPAGPVGTAQLSVVNHSAEEQVIWLSHDLPEFAEVSTSQPTADTVTVTVKVDLAQSAAMTATVPANGKVFVTTASGITTVQVTWRPMPYGSM